MSILGFLPLSAADAPTHALLYPGGLGGVVGLAVVLAAIGLLAAAGRLRIRSFDRDDASPDDRRSRAGT